MPETPAPDRPGSGPPPLCDPSPRHAGNRLPLNARNRRPHTPAQAYTPLARPAGIAPTPYTLHPTPPAQAGTPAKPPAAKRFIAETLAATSDPLRRDAVPFSQNWEKGPPVAHDRRVQRGLRAFPLLSRPFDPKTEPRHPPGPFLRHNAP
jgi:hypothetical protein